jgi:hypothetical protein
MARDEVPKLLSPNAGPSNPPRTVDETLKAMFPDRAITHENMPRRMQTVFDRPELYMREPEKGWTYAWPKYDRHMRAKLRTKEYILVDPSELREDCSLALDKKEIAGEEVVQMGDLVLVKITPAVSDILYRSRAAEGYMNAHGHGIQQSFEDSIGKLVSEGSVVTSVEHSQSKDP